MEHRQLLLDLQTSFDDLELRQLCASLQVPYEELPGYGRGEKVQSLIAGLEEQGRLDQLGEAVVAVRPHLARYYQRDDLNWLDEIASTMAVSIGELPTLKWASSAAAQDSSSADEVDAREQLLGQMPTMRWKDDGEGSGEGQAPTGPNPFLTETIVKEPEMFFGRAEELGSLLAGVKRRQSWVITGLKGIGKSTLLYQFARHISSPADEKLLSAYIDLSDPALDSPAAVHNAALKQWYGALIDAPAPEAADAADFARQIRTLHTAEFKVILCLEAPQKLLNPGKFGKAFLGQLGGMIQEGKLILAAAADPAAADSFNRDPAGAEFISLLKPLPLGLLDAAAAESLLVAPTASRGVLLSAQAAADGLRYCGRHPQFLQLMGCVLFDNITQGTYNRARCQRSFQLMAAVYWEELWQQLSPPQRQSLLSPISRNAPLVLARHYPALAELGLLVAEGQNFKRFSRGFDLWIGERSG